MEVLIVPVIWFCWKWSELVLHIRTHGLDRDPAMHKKWEDETRKAASKEGWFS